MQKVPQVMFLKFDVLPSVHWTQCSHYDQCHISAKPAGEDVLRQPDFSHNEKNKKTSASFQTTAKTYIRCLTLYKYRTS